AELEWYALDACDAPPAHPFTELLLRPIAFCPPSLEIGRNRARFWPSLACCRLLSGATAQSPGGCSMTTVLLNRRNLIAAGGSVLATGISGLLLPVWAEGLAPTPSMLGGS